MPQQPSKPKRGRPKGPKRITLADYARAHKLNGKLCHFIRQHIANDPKPYGRKARAYRAASVKFGGLPRTTIDRRIQIFDRIEPMLVAEISKLKLFAAEYGPLIKRGRAAFSPEEWTAISELATPIIEPLIEDRETSIAAKNSKLRRK